MSTDGSDGRVDLVALRAGLPPAMAEATDGFERHLRLDPAGRCLALRARIGGRVEGTVYALRPDGCRRVEPGSERCLQYRRERGVDR